MLRSQPLVSRVLARNVGKISRRNKGDGLSFWESNNFDNYMKNMGKRQAHAAKTGPFWMKMSFLVAIPATLLAGYNAYKKEEVEHHKPRPPFIPYEHLRIRTSPFPWGDGNHSLFHNPEKNALPEGYEVPDPNAEGAHH